MTDKPSTVEHLTLGEIATINGHIVHRVGLCGDGAFTVDGQHYNISDLGWVLLAPIDGTSATLTAVPVPVPTAPPAPVVVVPLLTTASGAARPIARQRQRLARASTTPAAKPSRPPVSELLADTKEAFAMLGKGVVFQHRTFAGGEAVTVTLPTGANTAAHQAAAVRAATSSGLFAQISGQSIVVALSRAILQGSTSEPKKARAS